MNLEFNEVPECIPISSDRALRSSVFTLLNVLLRSPCLSQGACGSCLSKPVRPHKHIPIFCFTELVVPNNPNTII